MAAKRNKKEDEQVKAQGEIVDAAPVSEPEAPAAEETFADDKFPDDKPAPINADKMAAEIKTTGNSYQQYARQMFKDRLEANR